MKKTVFFLLLLFITAVSFAQKPERKPFNKKAAIEFADQEPQNQLYLDRAEKFVLTSIKYDTTYTAKNGHPIRTVTSTVTTVTIRKNEKGVVYEWEGDDKVWVIFSTEDKQGLKLPFVTSAGGRGNSGNNMILMTDTVCGYQFDGSPIPCKPSARIITLGSSDDDDLTTYTFEGEKPKIVFEPIFKQVNKVKKVKSKGKKAAK